MIARLRGGPHSASLLARGARRTGLHSVALLSSIAVLAFAPAAHADGDPASDYLVSQQTFVSPNAGVSSSAKEQLNALVAQSGRHGYAIRIAIIQSRYDLGAVGVLDKKPRLYAHFLSEELQFAYKRHLLVVMPNGYGIAEDGKPAQAEQALLDELPPAGTLAGAGLVAAAETALQALARHAGVPLASPRSPRNDTIRNRILVSSVAVLLLAGSALVYLRRSRSAQARVPEEC